MTAVAMTEQIRAGVQVSNPTDEQTILTSAPSEARSAINTDSDIEEDIAIAGTNGTYAKDGDALPPSDPALLHLVSMQVDLDRKQKYHREPRLTFMFVFLAWSSLAAVVNTSIEFQPSNAESTITGIMLVYWCLNVALCMVMWIGYLVRFRSESTFKEYLNDLLFVKHTPSEHDMFEMPGKRYIGFWLYSAIIYNAVIQIFKSCWELMDAPKLMWTATQTMTPIGVAVISMLFMYSVTPQCIDEVMDKQRKMLINRYPKVKNMDKSILNTLREEMKEQGAFRPVLFGSIYIVVVSVLMIAPIFDWGLYSDGVYLIKWDTLNGLSGLERDPYSTIAQVMIWPVYMLEAIPWTFLFYFVSWVTRHFTFPGRLMDLLDEKLLQQPLSSSIPGFIQDLVAWWELRSFYMCCTVQVYTWAISPLIAICLVAVVVLFCIIFLFVLGNVQEEGQDDYWDCLIMFIYVMALLNCMFLMVKIAADYHMKQLDHISTIERKLLEVQRNELMKKYASDELTSRLYPTVVHSIMKDMESNYDAIRVFGFRVDNNFMLFLKSIMSTLVVSLGAAVVGQFTG